LPDRAELLARVNAFAETHGDDELELLLRLGNILGNAGPRSQRALTRLVEDYEDGYPSSTRILTSPDRAERRHRYDRVAVDHVTGQNAQLIFEGPGERRNAS
jgi:hypothetical protein